MTRALDNAEREAQTRGHSFIGTEHLLLALASEDDGVARNVFDQLGVTDDVRRLVRTEMESERYRSGS